MTAAEYQALRKRIGSRDKASKLLDVSVATIIKRESGSRVRREAEMALRYAILLEQQGKTPEWRLVSKPQIGRRR